MPRYTYRCLKCELEYDVQHLVGETPENCSAISDCEIGAEVEKILNMMARPEKREQQTTVGTTVRKFIEDARTEVKAEKVRLRKKSRKMDE